MIHRKEALSKCESKLKVICHGHKMNSLEQRMDRVEKMVECVQQTLDQIKITLDEPYAFKKSLK